MENGFAKAYILNERGEKVFTTEGKLKFMGGKLYRLNQKSACFTIKRMHFNGSIWIKGEKKIVAYPRTELYRVLDSAIDYCDEVEEIVDSPVFEECKLKVKGVWYKYNGDLVTAETNTEKGDDNFLQENSMQRIIKNPMYAVRKQALLRAMGFFRMPVKIKDIARTISRTAWGAVIKEKDVEEIINTIAEVESVDGKYILRKDRPF